jgi:hypothetical protein
MRRASRRAGDRFDAAECPVLNVLSITTPIGPNVSCWHEAAVRRVQLPPLSGVQRSRNARCETFLILTLSGPNVFAG